MADQAGLSHSLIDVGESAQSEKTFTAEDAENAEKTRVTGLSGPKLHLTEGELMVREYYCPSGKSLSCFSWQVF